MKRGVLTVVLLALLPCGALAAEPCALRGSPLALSLIAAGSRPELVFAQRTIERRWGPSEDSTYREIAIPDWKSEGGAFAMSAIVPGAGQLYTGSRSGYLFLLGEALGIYQAWHLARRADELDRLARNYAGNPNDSLSRWSFDTYEKRTGHSTSDLRSLFANDPDLFYFRLARDESLRRGWADFGYAEIEREQFIEDRDNGEERRKRSRLFEGVVLLNHAFAAFDALRSARALNMPLQHNLDFHVHTGWRHGSPTLTAMLEKKF